MTKSTRLIFCDDCGHQLPKEWNSDASASQPCSECGSDKQRVAIGADDDLALKLYDRIKLKAKDDTYPSKKKVRKEIIAGDDKRASRGDYVYKRRVIDRDNDLYIEKVVDKKTGEIIHEVVESLKEHFGHGSAKGKE